MCEVCDQKEAESVFHGHAMHKGCAPKHWVKDHKDRDEFMTRFHEWWATASTWKRNWDGSRRNREDS